MWVHEHFWFGICTGIFIIAILSFVSNGSLLPDFKIEPQLLSPEEIIGTVTNITSENKALHTRINELTFNLTDAKKKADEYANTSFYYQYQLANDQLKAEIENRPDYISISFLVISFSGSVTCFVTFFVIRRHQTHRIEEQDKRIKELLKIKKEFEELKLKEVKND